MIVSESNSFLESAGPSKGDLKMPSLVVAPTKMPDNTQSRRTRYMSQLRDRGVLLKPKDFREWRSKLDVLKQVVRVQAPQELHIHSSKFVMSKRRALTIDKQGRVR